ncbi:MAG: hypothetical protein JSV33_15040 [bacterium]|nr:MAG: hypothetical protein JSV33_15040 [bacterium]
MPNPRALVDGIRELSPTQKALAATAPKELPRRVAVNFKGGRSGYLDMAARRSVVWAEILDFLQRQNRPVYVEIDPETSIITELLIPAVAQVHDITTTNGGDIEVKLIPSPALHYIRRDNPDFDQFRDALQSAKDEGKNVLVTATRETYEIIDVRVPPESIGPPAPPEPPGPPPNPGPDPPVSPQRAQDLFDMMNARSCDPCTATAPCIPFKFPDDGCYARAHEMCRLMFAEGEQPEKVWIYGSLDVPTSNHFNCRVGWWYHVAPTLLVTTSSGDEKWVIDPSLCSGPVTLDEWRDKQGDSSATFEYTDASPFWPRPYDTTDDDYSLTNYYLEEKRLLLKERCEDYGPLPYSCPIIKRCTFVTDRSTFGEDEVEALLVGGSPAVITAAFYVIVDGFSPEDLGITSFTPPNVAPNISPSSPISGMSAIATDLAADYSEYPKRRQRLTWTYRVDFTDTSGFTEEVRTITLTASISSVSADAVIQLIKQPNPYEIDGENTWLSTDLRVFQINEGASRFGVSMGSTPADASNFIKRVIVNLSTGASGGQTFDDISTDYTASQLELSERVGGTRVFNFAVARVRYRGLTLDAHDVRVFFRLFPVSTTSLAYNQSTTYRRGGQGGVTIPLLGIQGGELHTIPCFAEPRIDTTTMGMNAQTDDANVQDILHDASGAERHAYFGCWLDINKLQPLFPIYPSPPDGPFTSDLKTIQELIRNQHQCLMAEIAFDPAPIPEDSSPGGSDKLAQRNLSIVASANPGDIDSHRIPLTFEVRPTPAMLRPGEMPDELMIDWGNIPDGSVASVYIPGISAAVVLDLAREMYKVHRLSRIDDHTLQCHPGGITYIPIPPGVGANLASLLTVDLPETVTRKEVYSIVARQVTNTQWPPADTVPRSGESRSDTRKSIRWRSILGSFQLTIPVRKKEELLEPERCLLSVLRWIQKAIPEDNRWFPVFLRYVGNVAARVDALGGDSTKVSPSPRGEWRDRRAALCAGLGFMATMLLGACVVLLGVLGGGWLITAGIPILAALIVVAYLWLKNCRPAGCRLLRMLITALGLGAAVLAIIALVSTATPQLITALTISVVVIGIAILVGWIRRCL